MRGRLLVGLLIVSSLQVVAQENAPKATISDAPLTNEQIAVYRAVLTDYLKESEGALNLANVTVPVEGADGECLKGLIKVPKENSNSAVIHRIGPSLVGDMKIRLVDPHLQEEKVKENDPGRLMRKAIEEHRTFTDEQLDQSLKSAFHSGLFTLSEIVFDTEHRHAVVSYSFVCGGLCGHGNTLVLKKAGDHWAIAKRCGGWVS